MSTTDIERRPVAAQRGRTLTSEEWFGGGRRLGYDPYTGALESGSDAPLKVFLKHEGDLAHAVSFLPGFPDGSFGWAKVLPYLPSAAQMPKVFMDYVGMGDSDKPKDYGYSIAERTDLVEAVWRHLPVRSTTLVTFDFSSLVVLEHLRRRLERAERGEVVEGPNIRGIFMFNGGLFTDGHTHPWYTTPVLRRLPKRAHPRVGRSLKLFRMMTRVMWSNGYALPDAEVRELHSVLDRHDGLFYLAAGAGFVADQQRQADRLDFKQIFHAYRSKFPFLVGGSDEDPFEHRQIDLARERLAMFGLRIERLPGGHLTTSEHPKALAALIADFEGALSPI